jgi:hypothetical protein
MLSKFTIWDISRLVYAATTIPLLIVITFLLLVSTDFGIKIGLIGVAFAIIGLDLALISSVITDMEVKKVRDFSLYHEDIRREINLQAIHFNIILNRIDEKLDSLVIDKNELSPKLEGDLEKTKKGSIFNKIWQRVEDLDRDGPRWKKLGETYMFFGAIATTIEVISFVQTFDTSSWKTIGLIHYLVNAFLQLFTTIAPGVTVLGVGLAIYAFGINLIDNQKIK